MQIKLLIPFLFISFSANAHTFTGMVGFYDGLSHPVLGLDHFIAMVSVGIISTQIGRKEIWTIPATFVFIMIVGGFIGILTEVYLFLFESIISIIVEYGIILSVIFLGLAIAIEKKLSIYILMIFIIFFALCHGIAHGIEMPWASNPYLFALGFASGTATLHLFGVILGIILIKNYYSLLLLRVIGLLSAIYGVLLLV